MGCAVCSKPLRLSAAKAENGGLPAHEECDQLRLKLETGYHAARKSLRPETASLPVYSPTGMGTKSVGGDEAARGSLAPVAFLRRGREGDQPNDRPIRLHG